ncbi:hypothetical protein HYT57_04920 [Candidatus Woesearchaeota archaeon]|nr:hypothetical protein [Candidatus Woesearchaeota archaeon]
MSENITRTSIRELPPGYRLLRDIPVEIECKDGVYLAAETEIGLVTCGRGKSLDAAVADLVKVTLEQFDAFDGLRGSLFGLAKSTTDKLDVYITRASQIST